MSNVEFRNHDACERPHPKHRQCDALTVQYSITILVAEQIGIEDFTLSPPESSKMPFGTINRVTEEPFPVQAHGGEEFDLAAPRDMPSDTSLEYIANERRADIVGVKGLLQKWL